MRSPLAPPDDDDDDLEEDQQEPEEAQPEDEGQPPAEPDGDQDDQEDHSRFEPGLKVPDQVALHNLKEMLYLIYQPFFRFSLDYYELRDTIAALRFECRRLHEPIPDWLKNWFPDVVAYQDHDGHMEYDYNEKTPPEQQDDYLEKVAEDLGRWQRKSVKALKNGKRALVPFESEVLSADLTTFVREELGKCVEPGQVYKVFDDADFHY